MAGSKPKSSAARTPRSPTKRARDDEWYGGYFIRGDRRSRYLVWEAARTGRTENGRAVRHPRKGARCSAGNERKGGAERTGDRNGPGREVLPPRYAGARLSRQRQPRLPGNLHRLSGREAGPERRRETHRLETVQREDSPVQAARSQRGKMEVQAALPQRRAADKGPLAEIRPA